MLTGNPCSRYPGQSWNCSDIVETDEWVLHELWLDSVNDDEPGPLMCDIAIKTPDGVFHIIARAGDWP